MISDPIGDMIARLKNAARAQRTLVELPHSKVKMAIAKVLVAEGYVSDAQKIDADPTPRLRLTLAYRGRQPRLSDIRRLSKPGLRRYVKSDEIAPVMGGMGTAILSTPQGVMTGKEARKRRIGGEVLCELW